MQLTFRLMDETMKLKVSQLETNLSQKDVDFLRNIVEVCKNFEINTSDVRLSTFKLSDETIYNRHYIFVRKSDDFVKFLKHPRFSKLYKSNM